MARNRSPQITIVLTNEMLEKLHDAAKGRANTGALVRELIAAHLELEDAELPSWTPPQIKRKEPATV